MEQVHFSEDGPITKLALDDRGMTQRRGWEIAGQEGEKLDEKSLAVRHGGEKSYEKGGREFGRTVTARAREIRASEKRQMLFRGTKDVRL